jgi:hypothetical protein
MEMIGKENGNMSRLKFLYSALNELSNKSEITVTDFLALKAFVTSEKIDFESYKSAMEEDGSGLSRDSEAYLSLLVRIAADLSVTGGDLAASIYDAHSTASHAFYQWELDKE